MQPFFGELIERRRGIPLVPVSTKVIWAQSIQDYEYYVLWPARDYKLPSHNANQSKKSNTN